MAFWDDIIDKLSQTWPARMGQGVLSAAALPGDVYQGRTPVTDESGHTNPEVINRASDLSGLITGGALAAPAQRNAVGMGIRAYHGSPYDFNKFDLSKIGTGEGAQAYGHGLYFAENPAVAADYKKQLTGQYGPLINNQRFDSTNPYHIAATRLGITGDAEAAIKSLTEDLKYGASPQYAEAQRLLQSGAALPEANKGKMYEVNINASPEQFLQWDKSLAEQPQTVKDLAARFNMPEYRTGADFYGGVRGGNQAAATERLSQEGIPGIRYLDQGSRSPMSNLNDRVTSIQNLLEGAKKDPSLAEAFGGISRIESDLAKAQANLAAAKPTSNYVVFNPDIVDILKKYGLIGALGAGQLAPQGNGQQ